jgi:hypothetical protein
MASTITYTAVEIDVTAAQRRAIHDVPAITSDMGYVMKHALSSFTTDNLRPWVLRESDGAVAVIEGVAGAAFDVQREARSIVRVVDRREVRFDVGDVVTASLRARTIRSRVETVPGRDGAERKRQIDFDAAQGHDDPAVAYRAWLWERVEGRGVEIVENRILSQRRVSVVRRTDEVRPGFREARVLSRPEVKFRVRFRVTDPGLFETLVRTGVGSERAFGMGLLLIDEVTR